MRILVVEDNPKLASVIQDTFIAQGYAVDLAERGREGEEQGAADPPYDAIILDLMLPDADGVQVCRNLRRRGVKTPILILTALSNTADKVTGLEAGADDYLTKPFEFEELLARVRALLRRGQAAEAAVLRFEDLEVDLSRRTVLRSGHKIRLTSKEFSLLEHLIRHPNRVLSRASISNQVWDMELDPESNVIEVYISMLRRKVDKSFDRPLIHTVIGSGYMLSSEPPSA
jgi:DNA-binding response OmpR family regulator